MKIYTRTGDQGTTSLFGGGRVKKYHARIETYGTVDETNSHLGLARAQLEEQPGADRVEAVLERIQNELFVLGADLATPADARARTARIREEHVEQLEADIDAFEVDLPRLQHFVLPGGTPAGATLHVARTTCRRAERRAVEAADGEELGEYTVVYLNRLSDLLFVLARWVNRTAGVDEAEWRADAS